ncbi:MAG: hypothetical protein JWO14_1328 [Solirubrobacterales bacterium]|nr:hypothetical protein [Solirubrobacterales bacterium]
MPAIGWEQSTCRKSPRGTAGGGKPQLEEYMSESTRLGRARGKKMLPVAVVATALIAMLAIASVASAATPNPISSGTTTLTINAKLLKSAKQAGIKITAVKPAKIKGSKATFAVTGGEIEATTGAGTITHSGGLKIVWGKKSVTLKSFTVSTSGKSLSAKIGGKTVKVASLAGVSATRLGFGNGITAKKVKLTSAGANALNKKLTPAPTKTKVKKNGKTITKTVKVKPPFKANALLGSSNTEVEVGTDNVLAKETMVFNGDATLLGKLKDVGVELQTISPTTASGTTFTSPIAGGTIAPNGSTGAVNSSGGLKLVQNLKQGPSTSITLANIGVDLAAKTAGVEVIGESNAESEGKKPLNVGNLGRSSIADLTITSTNPSPATRTVGVNANAVIQPVAAEVLEGFVKVYQGYYTAFVGATLTEEVKGGKIPPMSAAEIEAAAKKAGEAKVANDQIKAGEALGSFSFIAAGE